MTVNGHDSPVDRPETSLTGVSWLGPLDPYPQYIIRDRTHWAFTGVTYGRFGIYGVPGDLMPRSIVGNETDHRQPSSPHGFKTLAEVPAQGKDFGDPDAEIAATMGIFVKGKGQVLTVGTINWSLGLGHDEDIDQITLNIFSQLR